MPSDDRSIPQGWHTLQVQKIKNNQPTLKAFLPGSNDQGGLLKRQADWMRKHPSKEPLIHKRTAYGRKRENGEEEDLMY